MHYHDERVPTIESKVPIMDDSDRANLWQVCYHIAYILIGIITLIMAIASFTSLQAYSNSVKDFKNNWETLPLVDIIATESNCPEDYESLITRKWPGTVEGCDCSGSHRGIHYSDLNPGSWDHNQTRESCRNVLPLKPIPLQKFYSYRICGLRGGQNFANLRRPISTENQAPSWPMNYQTWGSGEADNQIWVPDGEKCPINDVYIVGPGDSYNQNYTTFDLDDGYKIAFTTKGTGLPIIRFRLTEGKVCANPALYEKDRNRSLYMLINTERYGTWSPKVADSRHDNRYNLIGSIDEYKLFEDNGVNIKVAKRLPEYPIYDGMNIAWNLYSNSYNDWSLDCESQSKMSRSQMVSIIKDALNVTDYQLTLMMVWILQVFVCCCIIEGILLCMACNEAGHEAKRIWKRVAFVIKILFAFLKAYYFWTWYKISTRYEDRILQMEQADWSSEYTNDVFEDFGSSLYRSTKNNFQGLILTICSIFIICLFFCVHMCTFDRRNRYGKFLDNSI